MNERTPLLGSAESRAETGGANNGAVEETAMFGDTTTVPTDAEGYTNMLNITLRFLFIP